MFESEVSRSICVIARCAMYAYFVWFALGDFQLAVESSGGHDYLMSMSTPRPSSPSPSLSPHRRPASEHASSSSPYSLAAGVVLQQKFVPRARLFMQGPFESGRPPRHPLALQSELVGLDRSFICIIAMSNRISFLQRDFKAHDAIRRSPFLHLPLHVHSLPQLASPPQARVGFRSHKRHRFGLCGHEQQLRNSIRPVMLEFGSGPLLAPHSCCRR